MMGSAGLEQNALVAVDHTYLSGASKVAKDLAEILTKRGDTLV